MSGRQSVKSVLLIIAMVFSANVFATSVPDALLNLPITLINGEQTSLAEYKGKKPVYLKFWATWCQPCRKQMSHFEQINKQYGDKIEVIGINIWVSDELKAIEQTIKEFGLSMPMAIDKSGDLAQAFRFTGTPYHLLFDKNMNLIHVGHQADEALDNKIALVSQTKPVDLLDLDVLLENEAGINFSFEKGKVNALFFTATWCDWYLKESRPQVSQNCSTAQHNINDLYKKFPNIEWNGVITRLWTGEKDLLEYKRKYTIAHAMTIDKSNSLFHEYSVKDLPTLVLIKDNKVLLKTSDFSDAKVLEDALIKY